jgi:hypothetical protein
MRTALRPYATAGVALVGASIIAVTPIAAPLPEIQMRPVKLVDAWSDLISETTTNLQLIAAGANETEISGVFSALLTNPLGVIGALTNLDPTVTTDLGTLPGTINIELPPGLELALAQLGAEGATLNAINDIVGQLATNPSGAFNTLLEAPATIANAFLNGEDNISLLNGIINIAGFNGILAPLQDVSINLNLPDLLNALGVGDTSLSSLGINLTDLLDQLQLGNLDLGGLFTALGIGDDGLGTLLGNPTLGSLLGDLGLGNLGLGSLSLTNLLGLGLDGNVDLSSLTLDQVLTAFGIEPDLPIVAPLSSFLDALGLGPALSVGLGTELSSLGLLQPILSDLGVVLNAVPGLSGVLGLIGLTPSTLLSLSGFETALNSQTIGSLLTGPDLDLHTTVTNLFDALGVSVPTDLNIGGILVGLGFPADTGALTLNDLLGGLNLDGLSLTTLLNGVNLGDLLGDLSLNGLPLADLPLDLGNLGSLGDLTVSGLLGDLGLGDLATINIDGFGGLGTLLADVIPQQILAAL